MLRTITITAMIARAVMLTGCAADTTAPDQESADARAAQAETQLRTFTLRVDSSTTAENFTPAVVASVRDKLVGACDATPDKAVRIFNPYESRAYEDVACSALLAGDDVTAKTSGALICSESDGPLGQVRQKVGPISFLFCGLFVGGGTAFLDKVLCPRAPTEDARRNCGNVELTGGIALGILCSIPF